MRFAVMIRRTSTGYSADVPDVPGCVATGGTVELTREMIARALEGHLELLAHGGGAVPRPSHAVEFTFDDQSAEEFCTWVDADVPALTTP